MSGQLHNWPSVSEVSIEDIDERGNHRHLAPGKDTLGSFSIDFPVVHDDVITRKRFPYYWPSQVDSTHEAPVMQSFDIFLVVYLDVSCWTSTYLSVICANICIMLQVGVY